MKNSIAERVYDFLKSYPPFNILKNEDLLEISKKVSIVYLEKGDTLFKKGDAFNAHFYMVRNGAITIFHTNNNNTQEIVNISDAGDIFGVRPLITKEDYKLTATANEESIVYAIPIDTFQSVTHNNASVYKFLITAFATNAYDPYTAEETGKIFADYLPNTSQDIVSFQTANYTKNPICCNLKSSLKDAALKMSSHKIGCIIVIDDDEKPVGIITNSDIKNKIATGLFPIETPVTHIMSSPVITNKKDLTVADGQLQMIKHNIGHLCITKDGTVNSKLIGVLTHHDVLVSLGNNPSVILKEIKRAKRTKTLRAARLKANTLLKSYLEQNIPISHIIKIVSQINDAVTSSAIEIALKKMPTPPPVKFSWIALGSQGRKEQLLFTDQDNAIVFQDVPKNKHEETQTYFLELAKLVTKSLNKIGFEYCEADMMASNPEWCKSITEWKLQFENWILRPDEKAILLSSIFFDYNSVYGDENLAEALSDSIYESLNKTSSFFKFLGSDAVKSPPPLGFFKQFLVEENGEQKDLFNIKRRALMPLIDAARLLILSHKIKGINNTYERFEKLAEIEPDNKELFESCSYAFKALLKFKTKQGILHTNSGKFIAIETLNKEEKLKLKRCFKPIHEVQETLKVRFDLKNFI
jgi:CBS domain-containing protein